MSDVTAQPRLLAIPEVADQLGVNPRHIRRLVHERRIPFIKWGHLIRFKPADIETWIDANRIELGQLGRITPTRRASAPVRSPQRRRPAQAGPSVGDRGEAPGQQLQLPEGP